MTAPQASSRLEMLQARFQQRQLAEKEQKLLQLYDQQQLRAHQVAQRGSAGSNGSNSSAHVNSGNLSHHQTVTRTSTHSTSNSQGGGKVRQMFDERRQTTVKGIDKSYPLEPLDNRSRKHQTTMTSNVSVNSSSPLKNVNPMSNRRSVVTRRTVRSEANGNVNNGKPVISYHREEISRVIGDSRDRDNEQDEFCDENYRVSRCANENRRIDRPDDLSIEDVTNDNTDQRHRTTAQIHLTEFDRSSVINRTSDNHRDNEELPDDEIVDVPERFPRRSSTGKQPSQPEARHERVKNFNIRKIGQTTKQQAAGNATSFTKKRNETTAHSGSSSGGSTVTRAMEEEISRARSTSPVFEGTEKSRNSSTRVSSDNTGKFGIDAQSRAPITKNSGITKVSQIAHKNSSDYYPRRKSEFEKSKTFRKLQLELGESSPEPNEPDESSSFVYGKECRKRSSTRDEMSIYTSERRSLSSSSPTLDRVYSKERKISREISPERPGSRRGSQSPTHRRRETLISNDIDKRGTASGGTKTSNLESSIYSSGRRRSSSSSSPFFDHDFSERKTSQVKSSEHPTYRRESLIKSEERRTTSGGIEASNFDASTFSSRCHSSFSTPIADYEFTNERKTRHEKSPERPESRGGYRTPNYRRDSIVKSEERETGSNFESSTCSSRQHSSSPRPAVDYDFTNERKTSRDITYERPRSRVRSYSPDDRRASIMENEGKKTRSGGIKTSNLDSGIFSSRHHSSSSIPIERKSNQSESLEFSGTRKESPSPNYRVESIMKNEERKRTREGIASRFDSSTYSSRRHSSSSRSITDRDLSNERKTSHEMSHEGSDLRERSQSPIYRRESIVKNEERQEAGGGIEKSRFDSSTYSSRHHSSSSRSINDRDLSNERKTSHEMSHEGSDLRKRSQSPIYRRESIVKNEEEGGEIEKSRFDSSTYSSRHHSSSSRSINDRDLSNERKTSHEISHEGSDLRERSQSPIYRRESIVKNEERQAAGGGIEKSRFDSSTYSSRHHSSSPIPIVDRHHCSKERATSHEISHEGLTSRERSQSPDDYRRESIIKNEEKKTTRGGIKVSNFDSSTYSSRHHASSPISRGDRDFSEERKTSHEISHEAPGSRAYERESSGKIKERKSTSEVIVRNEEEGTTREGRKTPNFESSTYSSRCHSSSPTPMADYDYPKERKTSREKSPERPGSRCESQSPIHRRESIVKNEERKMAIEEIKASNYDASSRRRSSGTIVDRDASKEREREYAIIENRRKSGETLRSFELVKKHARPGGSEKKPTSAATKSFERKITLVDIEFPAESSNLRDSAKRSRSPEHKIVKKDKAVMKTTKHDRSVKTEEKTYSRDARSKTISPSPRSPSTMRETTSFRAKKNERKISGDSNRKPELKHEFEKIDLTNETEKCKFDSKIDRSIDGKDSRRSSSEITVKRNDTFKIARPSQSRVLKIDNEKNSSKKNDLSLDKKITDELKDKSQLLERIEKIRSTLSRSGRSEQNLQSKEYKRTDSVESALRRFDSIGVETEHHVTVGFDETDILSSKPSFASIDLSSNEKKIPIKEKIFVKKIIKPLCKPAKITGVAAVKTQPRKIDVKSRVSSKEKLTRVNLREKNAEAAGKSAKAKKEKSIITAAATPRHSDDKMVAKSREGQKRTTSIVKKSKLRGEESSGRGEGRGIDAYSPLCKRKLFEDSESEMENENSRSTIVLTTITRRSNDSPEICKIVTRNNRENLTGRIEDTLGRAGSSLGDSKIDNEPTKVLRSIEDIRESIKRESQDFKRELNKFNTVMRKDAESSSATVGDSDSVVTSGIVSCVRITKTLKSGEREPIIKIERSSVKLPIARRVAKSPSPDIGTKRSTEGKTRTTTTSTVRRSVPSSPANSPEDTTNRCESSELKIPATKSLGRTSSSPSAGSREATRRTEFSTTTEYTDGNDGPTNDSQVTVTEIVSTTATKKNDDAFMIDLNDHEVSGSEDNRDKPSAIRKRSSERSLTSQKHHNGSRPGSALSTTSSAASARGHSSPINSKSKMSTKAKLSTTNGPKGPAPTNPRASTPGTDNDGLAPCKICGRRFNSDRVARHEQICSKTTTKKRKQFDATIHRIKGTELEPFVKKTGSKKTPADRKGQKTEVKSNWRRKHEDFINAIRSAKQVQAHLAAGGKLSDLPPPPPSDTSDYVQCPHCGRKFNQSAAERHIPKCQSMMHNKPNPRAPPKPKR